MLAAADEYVQLMPDVGELCLRFHLQPDAAFLLCRPKLKYQIRKLASIPVEGVSRRPYGDDAVIAAQKSASELFIEAANVVMERTCAQVVPFYPGAVWNNVSSTLFSLFWSLSLYDLAVPTQSYTTTIARLRKDKVPGASFCCP